MFYYNIENDAFYLTLELDQNLDDRQAIKYLRHWKTTLRYTSWILYKWGSDTDNKLGWENPEEKWLTKDIFCIWTNVLTKIKAVHYI